MTQAANLSALGSNVTTSGNLSSASTLTLQTNSTTALTIDTSQNVAFAKGFTVGATAAPAFSAYANAGQSLTSGVPTKILYGVEEFDTNSNFASSRFTPTVAGYYQINAQVQPNDSYTGIWIAIYKNGSLHRYGNYYLGTTGGSVVSSLVSLNGSSDYVEIYVLFSGGQPVGSGPHFTYFQGFLARSA
jgi:hypothetical protein